MTLQQATKPTTAGGLLAAHAAKDVLRFLTCGSVDDGKSTLIGRLLHDSKQLLDDQLIALRRESRRSASQHDGLDFALLVDGLSAEREQGITIDVAYRFFSTDKRTFIVADTPGHEQYTRNMATGASTADLAVLLVDARKGLSRQTRRHTLIASMLGIRHLVLAVNKMDKVGWSQNTYDAIMADYHAFAEPLGLKDIVGIPLSALNGDNVVDPGVAAPWYAGPTLLRHLETVEIAPQGATGPFRMPVQWVNRSGADFRGYAGTVAGGTVAVGDRLSVLPSGEQSTVSRIVTFDGDIARAAEGQSITLVLNDEVDVSRGDVLVGADDPPRVGDKLRARLFWIDERAGDQGRPLALKLGTTFAKAEIEAVFNRIDPDTAVHEPAHTLLRNEIGDVMLALDRPVTFDAYAQNRNTGSFILVDTETCDTVAMGLILRS